MTQVAPRNAEPVARLRALDESEMQESVLGIADEHRRRTGYVPNFIRVMAISPGALSRTAAYAASLFMSDGRLGTGDRELLAVVVSAENKCSYCETHQTQGLAKALEDPILARRIALHYEDAGLAPRERALADLAVKITRDPAAARDADFDALREHGLDDEEIMEAIEVIAFFNFTNRIAGPLAIVPEDQAFE